MRRTIFEISLIAKPLGWFSRSVLRIAGWRIEGHVPDLPKCVVVVAPHTSNWDFPVAMLYAFALGLDASFLGKAELFRWPILGRLFYWLGGIPVQRDKAHGVVQDAVRAFRERDHLILGIAPEGTRKRVAAWKTGFYQIAVGARVPIALAFLDYGRKAGGFGPVLEPTGDINHDIQAIREFYAGVTACRPELTGPPTVSSLREDNTP